MKFDHVLHPRFILLGDTFRWCPYTFKGVLLFQFKAKVTFKVIVGALTGFLGRGPLVLMLQGKLRLRLRLGDCEKEKSEGSVN